MGSIVNTNVKNFLADQQVRYLIENNKFEEVYKEWDHYRAGFKVSASVLTRLFLAAGIDILRYMKRIPNGCFSHLSIHSIDIKRVI